MIYIDSSTFLARLLNQDRGDAARAIAQVEAGGHILVSSRLLWLEARRVVIREALLGNDVSALVDAHLMTVEQLPLTDRVWRYAASIEQHVRTLDAIHLATCELAGATLLTVGLDSSIRRAADARGIPSLPNV